MEPNFQFINPLIINLIRYFVLAGIPFLIFYVLFPDAFNKNKIQERWAKNKDFLREILHSMQTTLILAGVALLILGSPLGAYTQVYRDIGAFPLWWIPVSVLLSLIVHDAYFYWMHRTIHHPRLFRHVHLVHHKSINPSPWASYSFHFIEGVLEAMIAPIIFFTLPLHPLAILGFTTISFLMNVYGHLGFEIAPRWFRRSLLFELMNTSVHHNIHHKKFKGNYGLYFRVWDRVMGTEHPDYVKEFDAIQEKRFGPVKQTEANPHSLKQTILPGIFFLGLCLGVLSLHGQNSQEASILGLWKDDVKGGVMKVYEENGLFYGQLVSADDPEDEKKRQGRTPVLMKDFERTSDTTFCCGTIYQPKEERLITATLVLEDAKTLVINGKYGVFRGKRVWRRL